MSEKGKYYEVDTSAYNGGWTTMFAESREEAERMVIDYWENEAVVFEKGEDDMNLIELVNKVEQWSKDKGLDKAESSKQALKFFEEAGEVAAALARGQEEAFKDGVGDTIVTLIVLAKQQGTDLTECLDMAYGEIKNRKGKMINGVFIKNEDLED